MKSVNKIKKRKLNTTLETNSNNYWITIFPNQKSKAYKNLLTMIS